MKSFEDENITISPIAHIYNDYTEKFGIPRQSGLVSSEISRIEFCEKYRSEDAVRGLDGFSHIWIIWGFSQSEREKVSLTVRPPKLGGNERVGVFASRSPFRPNPLGLSCVKLVRTDYSDGRAFIYVSGADMMNGTPIFDIKPYVPYADCKPDASGGFVSRTDKTVLKIVDSHNVLAQFSKAQAEALKEVFSLDPRPGYQDDENRVYGLTFARKNIKFRVSDGKVYILEAE